MSSTSVVLPISTWHSPDHDCQVVRVVEFKSRFIVAKANKYLPNSSDDSRGIAGAYTGHKDMRNEPWPEQEPNKKKWLFRQ